MKKYFKKNLLKLCTLATVLCTTASVGAVMASAEESTQATGKSLSEVSFTMMNGASIRTDGTGIRFSALLSQDDYDGLTVQYGEDLEFGTFIMAAKYLDSKSGGAFTEEQFFGDYDNDDTTTSIYTWEGATVTEDRVQILQMESTAYLDTKENAMRVNGSVTRVYDNNLDMDYIGVCYIKAGTEYKLASLNNNVRNVVYVSQLAVAKSESADFVSAGQAVIDHYTTLADAVTSVNYTVNTYLDDEGSFVTYKTETLESPLNDPITVADIASTITTAKGTYNYVASRSTSEGVAYIGDKATLELYYHKKSANVLYDFYDKDEALEIKATDATSTATGFDGHNVTSFDRNGSTNWSYTNIGNALNTAFGDQLATTDADTGETTVATIDYVYLYVYPQIADTTNATLLFYYYEWNGTAWAEAGTSASLTANAWNILKISVPDTVTTFTNVKFLFIKKVGTSNQPLGNTDGDTVYISEIGVISDTVVYDYNGYSDMTKVLSGASTAWDDSQGRNFDSDYVYGGDWSLRLYSKNRYTKYFFTEEFYNWLTTNEITKFSFKVYADATSTCKVSKIEGGGGIADDVYKGSVTNNSWFTIMVSVSNMTTSSYIQFNKNVANTTMNIYIDNFTFTYAS